MESDDNVPYFKLKIGSLNVNGLMRNLALVNNYFNRHQLSILAIQETHKLDLYMLERWANNNKITLLLNYKLHDNSLSSRFCKGTLFLIRDSLAKSSTLTNKILIENRIQKLNVKMKEMTLSVINCYFPQNVDEKKGIIQKLQENLISDAHLILVGDYNLITEPLDTAHPKNYVNRKDRVAFKTLTKKLELTDIFRKQNRTKQTFTYYHPNGQTRIDRIYVSKNIEYLVKNITHETVNFSDHFQQPILTISNAPYNNTHIKWGEGTYKLNSTVLKYPHVISNITTAWQNWKLRKDEYESILIWWDDGKTMLKNKLIELSSEIAAIQKQNYHKHKQRLEEINSSQQGVSETANEHNTLQEQINKYNNSSLQGAQLRANLNLIESEEPSSEFFRFESNNGKKKTITELLSDHNILLTQKEDILEETYSFYYKLWGINPHVNEEEQNEYISILNDVNITNDQVQDTELLISMEETEIAINQLNKDSAPGSDGLSNIFYKTCWSIIKEDFVEMINNCFLQKRMVPSMGEAIVKLIHKKNQRSLLKNWRPISLLNTDYKILSKVLSNRITPILNDTIMNNQKCGLPGRRMEEVLYNIQATLEISKTKNLSMYLMITDFEKAFDRVNHSFIYKIFKKLGFGPMMIQWLQIVYENITSKIQINGAFTQPILIKRGIRQGCPLSMIYFILAADVLTRHVESNSAIKGFLFNKQEIKIQQYADDTTFICANIESLTQINKELKKYEKVSGQKVNDNKTQFYTQPRTLKDEIKQKFPNAKISEDFKILGIVFGKNMKKIAYSDWNKVIGKIAGIADKHKVRRLSVSGKIQIINTLIVPNTLHVARISMPTCDHIKKINKILFNFLWFPSVVENLQREKTYPNYKEGGIKMIDIASKFKTCQLDRIQQLRKLENSNEIWHEWAKYNLSYKMRHINNKLYTIREPHAENPNNLYAEFFRSFLYLKKMNYDWETISFKSMYETLKTKNENRVQLTNEKNNTIPWLDVLLKHEKIKKYFSNQFVELSFRIAHRAYKWGDFFKSSSSWNTRGKILNCKFCRKPNDNVKHLLIDCSFTKSVIKEIERMVYEMTDIKIEINEDMILYNHFSDGQFKNLLTLLLLNFAKMEIIKRKIILDTKNEYNWNNETFKNKILWVIKTKLKQTDFT